MNYSSALLQCFIEKFFYIPVTITWDFLNSLMHTI